MAHAHEATCCGLIPLPVFLAQWKNTLTDTANGAMRFIIGINDSEEESEEEKKYSYYACTREQWAEMTARCAPLWRAQASALKAQNKSLKARCEELHRLYHDSDDHLLYTQTELKDRDDELDKLNNAIKEILAEFCSETGKVAAQEVNENEQAPPAEEEEDQQAAGEDQSEQENQAAEEDQEPVVVEDQPTEEHQPAEEDYPTGTTEEDPEHVPQDPETVIASISGGSIWSTDSDLAENNKVDQGWVTPTETYASVVDTVPLDNWHTVAGKRYFWVGGTCWDPADLRDEPSVEESLNVDQTPRFAESDGDRYCEQYYSPAAGGPESPPPDATMEELEFDLAWPTALRYRLIQVKNTTVLALLRRALKMGQTAIHDYAKVHWPAAWFKYMADGPDGLGCTLGEIQSFISKLPRDAPAGAKWHIEDMSKLRNKIAHPDHLPLYRWNEHIFFAFEVARVLNDVPRARQVMQVSRELQVEADKVLQELQDLSGLTSLPNDPYNYPWKPHHERMFMTVIKAVERKDEKLNSREGICEPVLFRQAIQWDSQWWKHGQYFEKWDPAHHFGMEIVHEEVEHAFWSEQADVEKRLERKAEEEAAREAEARTRRRANSF